MQRAEHYQRLVAVRSLGLSAIAALITFALTDQAVPALALFAGSLIGIANLFHIARSFNRLVKGRRRYLVFLPIEGVLRVLLSGAAPFIIVGRGPWLGYLTYIAGFVAPLAVAIVAYQQQISDECAQTDALKTSN